MAVSKNTPRKAKVNIKYANRKASTMAEYTEGFEYIDPATGESDEIKITLHNVGYKWANKWMPKKKDKITAKIVCMSWNKAGQKKTFNCGKFCVDDVTLSGPTLTTTISGVSVPEGNAFRSTGRNKTWKKVTLQELAARIASRYHMQLSYTGPTIKLEAIEQSNENDCSFLKKICDSYGMAIKVYNGKIVIYDKGIYESRAPVATLNVAQLLDWSYNDTLVGTYTGAEIKYTSGSDNKDLTCKVGGGKRILFINEKADNLADARLKACGKVNTENEKAVTMTATIMANTKIVSGSTIMIKGLYKINGKYFVDKVTHKIEAESAYTMDLELHKVKKRIK